jgi:hypothetical protein
MRKAFRQVGFRRPVDHSRVAFDLRQKILLNRDGCSGVESVALSAQCASSLAFKPSPVI